MPSDMPHPRGGKFRSKAQQRYWFATRGQAAGREVAHATAPAGYKGEHPVNAAHLPQRVHKRNETGNGIVVGRAFIEKSGQPTAPTLARTGGLQPKKMLVRSNAMGSIAAMPELTAGATGSQPVGKAAPGSYKTIDQRELQARRARKTQRHGVGVASVGASTAAGAYLTGRTAGGGHHGSGNRAMHEARRIHEPFTQRGATWALHRRSGATTIGPLGRREALTLAARRVPHNPLGATLLGGAALTAAGTAHYAQGRAREAYQQRRINTRRKANAQRSSIGKADRYYDPEDRRQRRRGVAAGGLAAGGTYLTARGGRQAVKHVREQNAEATRGALEHLSHHLPPGTDKRARVLVNAISGRKATVIHHGTTGRLLGGAALLGSAGQLLRGSDDPRRRRWR